jgi:hypothetical protein
LDNSVNQGKGKKEKGKNKIFKNENSGFAWAKPQYAWLARARGIWQHSIGAN